MFYVHKGHKARLIFIRLFRPVSWREQFKQRCPDAPHPRHFVPLKPAKRLSMDCLRGLLLELLPRVEPSPIRLWISHSSSPFTRPQGTPWYEPRLRDSTLKNTTLLVKEEAALECCLGKNVCIYVQVKACTEMTFASGLMLMDGRWIEKNIHSYFVKFRVKPIGSSEKILNPVTSLKLKELCWENTP